MRRKNIYFGFGPAAKKERLTVYRRPKQRQRPISHGRQKRGDGSWAPKVERADLISALVNLGYDRSVARKMATSAQGSDFDSQLRDALRRNPRILPEMTLPQIAAIRKLIRGGRMAQKKRRTKKKNSRKGKMPAGLKAYWAKKRRAKANPLKRRRKKKNPRARVRTRTIVRYRTRKVKVYPKRRRKLNPRLRRAKRINLKGFTRSQIKRVASAIRSATGKRVRIVKP
jgi:hypothetical protein